MFVKKSIVIKKPNTEYCYSPVTLLTAVSGENTVLLSDTATFGQFKSFAGDGAAYWEKPTSHNAAADWLLSSDKQQTIIRSCLTMMVYESVIACRHVSHNSLSSLAATFWLLSHSKFCKLILALN